MKRKKILGALALSVACLVHGQVTLNVNNGGDDVLATSSPPPQVSHGGAKSLPPLNWIQMGSDGVVLSSLVPGSSTNLLQSRAYAMAGLSGVSVPNDRVNNPAAWYPIPVMGSNDPTGLQWFDPVNGIPSWMGTTTLTNPATAGENGHRIVFHCGGGYPVSAYVGEVSVTLSNANLNSIFGISTNTGGGDIAFNPNFVGVYFGPNRVYESHPDPTLGRYIAGGDDVVLDNGQYPSNSTYDAWIRFGATVSVSVTTPQGLLDMRNQFATGLKSVTARLYRTDGGEGSSMVVKAERTVYTAIPKLFIGRNPPGMVRLDIGGGQLNAPYNLLSRTNWQSNSVWQVSTNLYYTGVPIDVPATDAEGYFELRAAITP